MKWALNGQIRSLLIAGLFVVIALAAPSMALAPDTDVVEDGAAVDAVIHVDQTYQDETTMLPVTAVPVGSTVRWLWTGSMSHSVTSGLSGVTGPDGEFDSDVRHAQDEPENGGDEPFTVTFDEPGVYKYYCQVHLAQHGVLIVA